MRAFIIDAAVLILASSVTFGCSSDDGEEDPPPPPVPTTMTKWDLWSGGAQLRGANIWVGRADDPIYEGALGSGPYGPTFVQADFDALAATGANLVDISHPGLFTVASPYVVDADAQASLDRLVDMIGKANMFAVITMRTGPGRSEWSFHWGGDTTTDPTDGWFPASYYNEAVWQGQAAREGWAAMWRHIAERYADSPIVVAYDLMCEPNGNQTQHELGDPEEFYPAHINEMSDWNSLFPSLIDAVRAVDTDTPVIVGGMGYSGVDWLNHIASSADPRVVYAAHQYEPGEYTHQDPGAGVDYPGTIDGAAFDKAALTDLLAPVADFQGRTSAPVVFNEIGLVRWSPDAHVFMDDQIAALEAMGIGHAVWAWEVAAGIDDGEGDAFNFRLGPDSTTRSDDPTNALLGVYKKYWSQNERRPSLVTFE